MKIIDEMDDKIRKALCTKVDQTEPSEQNFAQILNGIKNSRSGYAMTFGFKRYIAAILCAVVILSGIFMFSDTTRTLAMDTIAAVKVIFVMDKNQNIVEKPATYSFLQPAFNKNTQSSDSDLSKQMGINVLFPATINGDFTLQRKAEAVGFIKDMDYETFRGLQNIAIQAFDNNNLFLDLEKYQPFRSVGATYVNPKGDQIGAVIYNQKISLHAENINITDTVQTKVTNQNAEWVSLNFPVYPDNDLTQKPSSLVSTKMLFWTVGDTTYQIWPINNSNVSMADTVRFAEAFMAQQ